VLSNYKTEPCKKPPRLCRQGYACPFYHNGKDRRRPPGIYKYRSTPCPGAKNGDDWADPEGCETGEGCQYCHTRTEQQFHPEIYKSTKCNDMLQHGYCPRGPFCAFAHTDAELHAERQVTKPVPSHSPLSNAEQTQQSIGKPPGSPEGVSVSGSQKIDIPEAPQPPTGVIRSFSENGPPTGMGPSLPGSAPSYSSVLKQRSQSMSNKTHPLTGQAQSSQQTPRPVLGQQQVGVGEMGPSSYPKAPGFEREQHSPTRIWAPEQNVPGQRIRTTSLNVTSQHQDTGQLQGNEMVGTPPTPASLRSHSFSPFGASGPPSGWPIGPPHPPPGGSAPIKEEGVVGSGPLTDFPLPELLEDVGGGLEVQSMSLEKDDGDINGRVVYGSSAPVKIPRNSDPLSQSLGASNTLGLFASSSDSQGGPFRMSGSFGQSMFPDVGSGSNSQQLDGTVLMTELARTKEELASHRGKLCAWEDGLKQARQACEAWRREAELHKRKMQIVEAEKSQALQERDMALSQLQALRTELTRMRVTQQGGGEGGPIADPAYLRLRNELELQQRGSGPICGRCGRHVNGSSGNAGCPVCSPGNKTQQGFITSSLG
jgi:hypothetical protein